MPYPLCVAPPSGGRRRPVPAVLLLLLGVAATLTLGCNRGPSAAPRGGAPPEGVPVVTATAVRHAVPVRVDGIGNVEAVVSVGVKSRIDGQIVRAAFSDGALVARDQALFEIDPRPGLAQLRQVQASLAKDIALLARAREQDARYKDLLERKFVSPEAYAQIHSALDSAIANVDADRAALDNARLQVEYATIRAPIAGRAGRILVQPGNVVKANDTGPLVTINQISPIYVSFAVPEQYLENIRRAMGSAPRQVDISAVAADGATSHVAGRLGFIDNNVDPVTGTVKLRATVDNADQLLWPGQFVHASLSLGEQADALVVPSAAVQNGPKGTYVFVVDAQSKAQIREVAVDRVAGAESVIAKGLAGGEQVVVDGQSRLLPGIQVNSAAHPADRSGAPPATPAKTS